MAQKISTGDPFDNWTAISDQFRTGGRTRVTCRCVCGTESDVLAYNLTSGKSTQCGDCSRGKSSTVLGLSNLTKRSVDQQNTYRPDSISFELTPETLSDTLTLQGNVCGLTSEPLTMESSSVVRFSNSSGYDPTNVMIVSSTAKAAMGEMDVTEFVNFAHQVTTTVTKRNPPRTTAEFFNRRDEE